jgi:hypothetical protein
MAVYKVIQDIEAEDKLLGPLTLKSFIYAAIAGVLIFIDFRLLVASGPFIIRFVVMLVLFFPMLLFGVLASPIGRDQPTEVWLLSHVRFMVKPRLRKWDQSGISQLVTITAPKREERQLTKNLSQTEVQSRLQALAGTLDSRGWVVKNSTVNLSGQADYLDDTTTGSDRLVAPSNYSQPGQVVDIHPADDILDEENNATAQHFNELMRKADEDRKQSIIAKINDARKSGVDITAGNNIGFMDDNQKSSNRPPSEPTPVVSMQAQPVQDDIDDADIIDDSMAEEAAALLERKHIRDAEIHRLSAAFHPKGEVDAKTIKASSNSSSNTKQVNQPATVTAPPTAAKLELAQSGNDLSVASIAHLANRGTHVEQVSPNEVIISLH